MISSPASSALVAGIKKLEHNYVPLQEILEAIGLTGEVTAAESSNPELFSVSDETREWVITSYQAFDTDEWMKVTIGGVVYTIAVTDAQKQTVTYIERHWDGTQVVAEEKTAEVQSFPDSTTIRPGWYYIDEHYKTISNRISLTGDTHLILKSNSGSGLNYAWLDVQGLYIPQGCTLTVYGQSMDTGDDIGTIFSNPDGRGGAGVGGYSGHPGGNIVLHGGHIWGIGDSHCPGIGSSDGLNGTITVYGGMLRGDGG